MRLYLGSAVSSGTKNSAMSTYPAFDRHDLVQSCVYDVCRLRNLCLIITAFCEMPCRSIVELVIYYTPKWGRRRFLFIIVTFAIGKTRTGSSYQRA